jgi:uncharacterized membrane protein YsdA (DUF1294 family)
LKNRVTVLAILFFLAVAISLFAWGMRSLPLIHLIAINVVAGVLMVLDKMMARLGRWRVPERVLLGSSLLGGTPATILSMRLARHKTRDKTYLPYFFISLGVQALLIGAVAWWWWTSRS